MTDNTRQVLEAREDERAKIIAWLKSSSDLHYTQGKRTLGRRLFWIWTAIIWPENIPAGILLGAARALEQGLDRSPSRTGGR